jgi:hypothetical protein
MEVEAIGPKFSSLEIAAAVEKLSGLAGMLHHHSLTKDKSMYIVKDCVEVYLNFNLTVRGLTFTKKDSRELLDQLVGICSNWISI